MRAPTSQHHGIAVLTFLQRNVLLSGEVVSNVIFYVRIHGVRESEAAPDRQWVLCCRQRLPNVWTPLSRSVVTHGDADVCLTTAPAM